VNLDAIALNFLPKKLDNDVCSCYFLIFGMLRTFSDVELTFPLMATRLLLAEESELSIK